MPSSRLKGLEFSLLTCTIIDLSKVLHIFFRPKTKVVDKYLKVKNSTSFSTAMMFSILAGWSSFFCKRLIYTLRYYLYNPMRRIARIKWFHKKTNYEVLRDCKIESMQCMVEGAILRWSGHVARMKSDRTPKLLLYGRLATGRTSRWATFAHLTWSY